MKISFPDLQRMVDELKATSSVNSKKDILAAYPQNKDILFYVHNSFFNFYVTSDNIKKQEKTLLASGPNLFSTNPASSSRTGNTYATIFDLLDALNERKATGLQAIRDILIFIKKNVQYRELIFNIIDRDLKCRIDAKLINKVYPKLIPSFSVALANNYWDIADSIDFTKENWFASHKIDGCRLITMIDENGDIKCLSRNGKELLTLERIKEEIRELFPKLRNYVFDGEICIVDDEGIEHFSEVMKQVTRKNHTITFPRYKIFDLLHYDEFEPGESTVDLAKRFERWNHITENGKITSNILTFLPQIPIQNKEHFEELFAEAQKKNWEGLILRKNTIYKGKRSNDLLKVKAFFDAEYEVIRSENGPFQVIVDGKELTENMMTRVFIKHRGYEVGVGSGFTLEERRDFYKHPKHIVEYYLWVCQ